MKKLRICHIITRLDKGGSSENTLLTVLGNRAHGHQVTLLCGVSDNPSSENEELARKRGVTIRRFNSLVREISPVKDGIVTLQLYFYLLRHPCDILHTHTSKAGIVGRVAGILAGIGTIIHTPHGHIFYGYFSPLKTTIFIAVERFVTRWTSALITLTRREREDYLDRRIGKPDRIVPIYSGIDLKPFLKDDVEKKTVRRELKLPIDGYLAGTVARLVTVKNHDLIISAAEQLRDSIPELTFVFVGDGDLHEHLEKRIKRIGLSDRFIFYGWCNDIPRILKGFDLFIMCSHNEGMGRVFAEAQASGLPVIGSNVGGIPEVLREGITGYLISPDDAAALAKQIEILYNKRDEQERIARQCREWVTPRFSKETMIDAIESVYYRSLGVFGN